MREAIVDGQAGQLTESFGIGCLPFELDFAEPGTQWADEVSTALLGIAAVSGVAIEGETQNVPSLLPPEYPVLHDNARDFFWPPLINVSIEFQVTIPERLQAELLPEKTTIGCEVFHVHTHYGWHGPVTFVTCLSPDEDVKCDRAVALVHAFISRELRNAGRKVRIARVGPSPFHMTGRLTGDLNLDMPIAVQILGVFRYTDYEFSYDPRSFDAISDARMAVQSAVHDQLELFYDLQRRGNRLVQEVHDLDEEVDALAAKHLRTGWRAYLGRVFRTAADARQVGLKALTLKGALQDLSSYQARYIEACREDSMAVFAFEKFLDRDFAPSSSSVIERAIQVVNLVETSRRSEFEVALVAGATLAGAGIGALAGALVAGGGP